MNVMDTIVWLQIVARGIFGLIIMVSVCSKPVYGMENALEYATYLPSPSAEETQAKNDFQVHVPGVLYASVVSNMDESLGELDAQAVRYSFQNSYSVKFHKVLNRLLLSSGHEQQPWEEMDKIGDAFVHDAIKYGRIIIEERLLPKESKTIKPTNLGGIAGGEKYVAQGILFKFAQDKKLANKWLYGGQVQNDFLAAKAAGQELLSANYIGTCLPSIRVPLMAIIDYWGHRLIAIALLPIYKRSLLYGSGDGGKTVVASDPNVNEVMEKVGEKLNLKKHMVGSVPMSLCGDIEVHACDFGDQERYYYCLDTARVFPPEAPSENSQDVFFKKLRPEFVRGYREALSSDGFTEFQRADTGARSFNEEIRSATKVLLDDSIRDYAAKLADEKMIKKILYTTSLYYAVRWTYKEGVPNPLVSHMHKYGFNLRHLGKIYKALDEIPINNTKVSIEMIQRLKRYIENVMISRVLKNYARTILRDEVNEGKEYRETLIKLLNEISCSYSALPISTLWNTTLPSMIQAKFSISMNDLIQRRNQGFLLLTFCQLLGIIIHPKTFSEVVACHADKMDYTFTIVDIVDVQPTIKYLNYIDLAAGLVYLKCCTSDIRASSDREIRRIKMNYARMAKDRLQSALMNWANRELLPRDLVDKLKSLKRVIAEDKKQSALEELSALDRLVAREDELFTGTVTFWNPRAKVAQDDSGCVAF